MTGHRAAEGAKNADVLGSRAASRERHAAPRWRGLDRAQRGGRSGGEGVGSSPTLRLAGRGGRSGGEGVGSSPTLRLAGPSGRNGLGRGPQTPAAEFFSNRVWSGLRDILTPLRRRANPLPTLAYANQARGLRPPRARANANQGERRARGRRSVQRPRRSESPARAQHRAEDEQGSVLPHPHRGELAWGAGRAVVDSGVWSQCPVLDSMQHPWFHPARGGDLK
jgi:hypothetical protein